MAASKAQVWLLTAHSEGQERKPHAFKSRMTSFDHASLTVGQLEDSGVSGLVGDVGGVTAAVDVVEQRELGRGGAVPDARSTASP